MKESLLCNFKAMTETSDFLRDLSAISFSHMDVVWYGPVDNISGPGLRACRVHGSIKFSPYLLLSA